MKPKLLVIDDDPLITALYQRRFETVGFNVEVAADGAQGLAAVRRFNPDIVLLDLNMPNVTGVEWLRAIRDDPKFHQLPVVVFTAGVGSWQETSLRNSDVTYVLPKAGTKPQAVVDAVRAAALGKH